MTRRLALLVCFSLAGACGGPATAPPRGATSAAPGSPGVVALTGAGATFPFPIYSKWFDEYGKTHASVQINYQSLGSGAGIRQLLAGTVDFGASDQPMTDEQLAQAGRKILHFPTVLGAVVPIYRLEGVSTDLKFTPAALAGIFLGTIRKWNDTEIAKANPGITLPAADVVVVHRSDGSGTSFVWTDFLAKVSPVWKQQVGRNAAVNWPVGLGGKGNEGVAGLVAQTPNSIGYVELVYALQTKLSYGMVQNAAGTFTKAGLQSVTAAAASVTEMPADFRVSITNAPGSDAYPIASFTWLLVPAPVQDPVKARTIADFLKWMLSEGQKMTEPLGYAPLPARVVDMERQTVDQIQARP